MLCPCNVLPFGTMVTDGKVLPLPNTKHSLRTANCMQAGEVILLGHHALDLMIAQHGTQL